MGTRTNRLRSATVVACAPPLAALIAGLGGPAGAQNSTKRALPDEQLISTRAGGYSVGFEKNNVQRYRRPAGNEEMPLQAVASLGLRVTPSTREDGIRFQGIGGPLTIVDDTGHEYRVPPSPGSSFKRLPNGRAVLLPQPGEKEFRLLLNLPNDRAQSLKVVKGELMEAEGPLQKMEISGKELRQAVERKVDGYTLRVDPVELGAEQSELNFTVTANFRGAEVTHDRILPPQFQVDLHDTEGNIFPALQGRFTGSLTVGRGGGKFNSTFTGDGPAGPGGRGLPSMQNRKFNRYFLSGHFRPDEPLPPVVTFDCQALMKFGALHDKEELAKVAIYLFRPKADPKRVPFQLSGVPLPPAPGQKRP